MIYWDLSKQTNKKYAKWRPRTVVTGGGRVNLDFVESNFDWKKKLSARELRQSNLLSE